MTGVDVRVSDSAEGLVRESDIVTLITSADEPIVDGSWWKPGTHINAIGSHVIGVRELDSATVVKSKVVCDQVQACLNEAGDIQIPIEERVYSADDIHGSLGDVVNGAIAGRENDEEITLFKSVGLAHSGHLLRRPRLRPGKGPRCWRRVRLRRVGIQHAAQPLNNHPFE